MERQGGFDLANVARILRVLDVLALAAVIHSYWGIDVAAYSPQILWPDFLRENPGSYWLLMYIQGIVAVIYLFLRVRYTNRPERPQAKGVALDER